ncbi:MAG: hypothetical protein ABI203_06930 [Mucilaginibacter sp.]
MELEEMKTRWNEMSAEIEKQKKLTDTLVIKMTQLNYSSKLNKIWIPEAMASFFCIPAALFILVNIRHLNTWYLLICGIISVLVLLISPVLSIRAIRKLRSANISANTFKQSLSEYSKAKIQFVFGQKLSFYLAAILMLTVTPVAVQLIGGNDLFAKINIWLFYAIGSPFVYLFARLTFKSYMKTLADAENILKELEN